VVNADARSVPDFTVAVSATLEPPAATLEIRIDKSNVREIVLLRKNLFLYDNSIYLLLIG
jgi:hypothetical protein